MSSELRVTGEIQFSKNGTTWRQSLTLTCDVAGDQSAGPFVQLIGTSDETIVPPDIAAGGYWYVENIDAVNYVQLGMDGTNYMMKLLPGKKAFFPLDPSATLHAKANTAACNVRVCAADL